MNTTSPQGGHSAGAQDSRPRDTQGLFIGRGKDGSKRAQGLDLSSGHYPVFPAPLASEDALPSSSPMSQFNQMSVGTTTLMLLPLAPTEPISKIGLFPGALHQLQLQLHQAQRSETVATGAASTSSTPSSVVLETFTLFLQLPKELQLPIWELDANRALIATVHGTRSPKVPAAMHACRESRKVGKKVRERMTIIRNDLKAVDLWINYENDIFYLRGMLPVIPQLRTNGPLPAFCGGRFPMQVRSGLWTTFLTPSYYRKLQRVAIPLDEGFKRSAYHGALNTTNLWLTMLHLCPLLVQLIFVVRPHPEGTYQTPDQFKPMTLKFDEKKQKVVGDSSTVAHKIAMIVLSYGYHRSDTKLPSISFVTGGC